MKIIPNWRAVLRRAWSVRLMVVAATLTGAEAALPLLTPAEPPRWWPWLVLGTVAAAFVARFAQQQGITPGAADE